MTVALNKPMTVNWNNQPLEYILQELSNVLDQKLFIDERSLTDLGINLKDKRFTLQANGISARMVRKGEHMPLVQFVKVQSLLFSSKDDAKSGADAADQYAFLVKVFGLNWN